MISMNFNIFFFIVFSRDLYGVNMFFSIVAFNTPYSTYEPMIFDKFETRHYSCHPIQTLSF